MTGYGAVWWSDAASIGKLVMSQANCCLLSHKLVHQPVRSNSGTMTVTLTFFITSLGVPPTSESQQIVVYYCIMYDPAAATAYSFALQCPDIVFAALLVMPALPDQIP